ncbi:MAG: flagellar hook assembly protein FlgD [Gammaproteobacteria bacterium]|nr:flagellar hook assembly protein FlgD [Gammaproteobacteria bacterium]
MSTINNNLSDLDALGLRSVDQLKATEPKGNDMNMEMFMELMTTQMKNQDPLKPMDNNQFLGQLAQFSSVQGLQTLNDNFSALASSLTSNQALQAGGLVDRSVLTEGSRAYFNPERGLEGELNLDSSGTDVQVRIYSAAGSLMKSLNLGTQAEGSLPFKWDGSLDAGGSAPAGVYRVEADYYDGKGRAPINTLVSARVDSVVVGKTNEQLTLNLEGMGSVPFNRISRIQ